MLDGERRSRIPCRGSDQEMFDHLHPDLLHKCSRSFSRVLGIIVMLEKPTKDICLIAPESRVPGVFIFFSMRFRRGSFVDDTHAAVHWKRSLQFSFYCFMRFSSTFSSEDVPVEMFTSVDGLDVS
ncbi:hypothetical protein DNTS_016474, partial [Danionella cerebrum]